MRSGADRRPVRITSAARSQEEQLRIRQFRYVTMMGIRLVCLVAAAILVSTQPPLWWLWVAFCAVGMIVLPWVAVVLANDRLPQQRHPGRHPGRPERAAAPPPRPHPELATGADPPAPAVPDAGTGGGAGTEPDAGAGSAEGMR